MDGAFLKDAVTIGIAMLGAVLGVMNTWHAMNQRRVRVRVTPHFAMALDGQPLGVTIEVINLSAFPVTMAEVGFSCGSGRVPIMLPQVIGGGGLPVRMQPREALSVWLNPAEFTAPEGKLGGAYVRTACGRVIYGNSPAGRQFSTMMQEIAAARR